ncbi:Ferrichrome-iron receptor [plant metagenome]|uniref:Ferrichrome-iron receptor n=1 Tax=plant metagenome TaxID=1297885 RepID=A0A484R044_9ZZZZ
MPRSAYPRQPAIRHPSQKAKYVLTLARQPASTRFLQASVVLGVMLAGVSAPSAAQNPAPSAMPQASADTRVYDIPAGPLSAVLTRYASEAGVFLVGASELAAGKQSPGVRGRHSVSGGLSAILAGTGLRAESSAPGRYVLREAGAVSELAPVTVTGTAFQESATGPVQGFVATRSAVGTKTDTPILETPQSVSVVGRDALETQGTLNVANGLRYTAGMGAAAYSNGDGNAYDTFTMRGFVVSNGGLLLDGMRLHYNVLDAPVEVYGLERVEVLRGPASMLYGQSGPSGVVNLVSKRPSTEARHEIEVTGGTNDRRQVATDHTGALNDTSTLSYRLTGLFRESGTFVDNGRDDRSFLAPSLTWQPSAATSLTVLASYQKSKGTYYMGLPYSGTVRSNPLGEPSRDTNLGDPRHDYWNSTSKSIGYVLDHAFNESVKLRQSVRYGESALRYGYLFHAAGGGDLPGNRVVARQSVRRLDDTSQLGADTNLSTRWQGLGGEHTTLLGFDYGRSHSDTFNYRGSAPATDLFSPVSGVPGVPSVMALRNSDKVRFEQLGVYAQQQSKFLDRWVVTLSGRQDWAENRALSRVSGLRQKQRDNAFTGRVGLTYLAPRGIAPYVSYATSFEPVGGVTYDGTPFKPTKGEQVEAGIKWQPPGSETLVTLAAYHLTQQNLPTLHPDQVAFPNGRVQTGEVTSKGVELEAATHLTRSLRLRGALTFNHSEITESNVPGEVGRRQPDTPARMASLWVDYRLPDAWVPGLLAGGGVRYVAGTHDGPNLVKTDGYTVYDAMLGYQVQNWKFTLNLMNVFDKRYLSSCYAFACYYGQPRMAMLTANYAW